MKFLSYYGMNRNMFLDVTSEKEAYESENYRNVISRLEYLKEVNGIGLFTGGTGSGKTYAIKCFKEKINDELYEVVYVKTNPGLTTFEFLNVMCKAFGLDVGNCYRNDVCNKIQKQIRKIKEELNKNTILIIDNAENLKSDMIIDLRHLYECGMSNVDYLSIVLLGTSEIKEELRKTKHEPFRQRIIMKYELKNLTRGETKEYIRTRLELSGQNKMIYKEEAINALYGVSKGNIRKLNHIIVTSLMIGYQNEMKMIDEEIIRIAKEEDDI